jgi:hypothetical protein
MSSKHDEGKRVDEERRNKRMKDDKKKAKKGEKKQKAVSKKTEKSKDDLEAIKAKAKKDQEKEQKQGNAREKSNDDRAEATGKVESAKKAPPPDPKKAKEFVLWFDDLSSDDVALVGGKTSSLGEMYRQLTSKGGTLCVCVCYGWECGALTFLPTK